MRASPPHRTAAPAPSGSTVRRHHCLLLLLAALAAVAAVTPAAAAAAKSVCQPGDLEVPATSDCTAVRCAAQLAAHGLAGQLGAAPTTYQGTGGLCCKCSIQAKGSAAAAPAPSPAAAAPRGSGDGFWTQEDRPAAGPIVDAAPIGGAPGPAPAPAAAPDSNGLAKVVLLLREVWFPMSDAYIATVLGTLGALTKGASWTYRTQQPAAPSFQPQLPPQEEDEQWWVDSDPLQLPPEDNQGVLLFVDTELPRVRAAMAAATVVHASETGQLARALRQAGLQTKAADVLFAGSGPVTLNTTLLPSASQAAAGGSNSSSADAQGSGSSTGGSEGGGGSSLSAGAIAALCICCVALVAAVAGTVLHVRRRRARQGRYEVFQEVQRSGSSPISSSSTGGKPYEH